MKKNIIITLVMFCIAQNMLAQSEFAKKVLKFKDKECFYYSSLKERSLATLSTYGATLGGVDLLNLRCWNTQNGVVTSPLELIAVTSDIAINPQMSLSDDTENGKKYVKISPRSKVLVHKDDKIMSFDIGVKVFDTENLTDFKEENLTIYLGEVISITDLGDFEQVNGKEAKANNIKKYKSEIFLAFEKSYKVFMVNYPKTTEYFPIYQKAETASKAVLKALAKDPKHIAEIKFIENLEKEELKKDLDAYKNNLLKDVKEKTDKKIYGDVNTMLKEFYKKDGKYEFYSISYAGGSPVENGYYYSLTKVAPEPLVKLVFDDENQKVIGLEIAENYDQKLEERYKMSYLNYPRLVKDEDKRAKNKPAFVGSMLYEVENNIYSKPTVRSYAMMYKGYLFIASYENKSYGRDKTSNTQLHHWYAVKPVGLENGVEKEKIQLDKIKADYERYIGYMLED